jgi:hypothetical protein
MTTFVPISHTTPQPHFTPLTTPVLTLRALRGGFHAIPLPALSMLNQSGVNPMHMKPVPPLPGTASINQTVGYPT